MATDRPNIVLLVNDHQAYYRHGWDGGVRPMTPNFDRLAGEGALFERAYCSTPLCGPARRTLMTGLYPHNHRNYYNYSNPPYDHEIYLSRLAEHGYENIFIGKWHAGSGTALDFQAEGFSDEDYGNPYRTQEYKKYLKSRNLPDPEHCVEYFFSGPMMESQFPRMKKGPGYRSESSWSGEHAVGRTLSPKETHESFFLANLACDKLEQLSESASDRPFHLRVDFWGPHQPHFPTQEFVDLYDADEISEYGSFRDDLSGKPSPFWHDVHRPLADESNRFISPSPLAWREWQLIVARAYAHITMIDAAGGRILDKLDELGLADNTVLMWTTDHGDALASHGGRFDKGSFMSEEVIRVPLAIRHPDRAFVGQRITELVSGIDIAPTILDCAGLEFERPVDGKSILPLVKQESVRWREELLVETFGHGFGKRHQGRAVVSQDHKYVAWQDDLDELYDLVQDPFELQNLAGKSGSNRLLEEMQSRLATWISQTGDCYFNKPLSQKFIRDDENRLRELTERREAKGHS